MTRFLDWLSFRVAVAPWDRLPAFVWFLVASPLLRWALGGGGPLFAWPCGASRSPLRLSFWWVGGPAWLRERGPVYDLETGEEL